MYWNGFAYRFYNWLFVSIKYVLIERRIDVKVYIVERRTWSISSIKAIFLDKTKAENFADDLEKHKTHNDGYVEYYVEEFDVIE